MLRIYCPVCNGLLRLEDGEKRAVCVNCGRTVEVPQGYTELESSYLFAAESMQRRDFEGAYQAYGEILSSHPDQAEAYFRRALAFYEIEYQKTDGQEYRLICHQAEKTDFLGNEDVKKALELAKGPQREAYEEQAKSIHALQERVSAYAKAHPPVDVWISAAESSLTSLNRVVQIRQLLDSMGLSVFCGALDLSEEEKEWEPALYRAASTASVLILTASEAEAFTTEVNFDAERFLYRKEKALRAAKGQIPALFAAFENLDEYEDIPDSYFDGIDRRLDMGREGFAAELREAVEEALADYRGALKEQAGAREDFAYANLLLQARQSLESRSFKKAAQQYQEILLQSPTESQAYWGLLLASRKCATEQELIRSGKSISKENNYRNALAFASEREQQTYRETAAQTEEMAAVLAEQEKQREKAAYEQDEERRRRELEVHEAEKKKIQEEEKRRKGGKRRIKVFLLAVVVVLAGAGIGYMIYSKSPAGVMAKKYKEAASAYNHGQYLDAYGMYLDLEDYKDSAQMAQLCQGRLQQADYNEALNDLKDFMTRADAAARIRATKENVAEAEGKLAELEAEGIQYLEEGKLYEAWETLRELYDSDERSDKAAFLKAWRQAFNRGYLCGAKDKLLAVNREGDVMSYGLEGFGLEEGKALSVSLSDSGSSGGVVRRDGTAYLLGDARNFGGVEGWSNLVSIHVSDKLAAGLTADGDLYVTGRGRVASDVSVFDVYENIVLAVRNDGSLYCSSSSVQIPGDWSDIAYAILVPPSEREKELTQLPDFLLTEEEKEMRKNGQLGSTTPGVMAVTADGRLLESGVESGLKDTGVLAVYRGCGEQGVMSIDDRVASFATVAATDEETVFIKDERGDLVGQIYGSTDSDINMRNAMRDMDDVGMPCPYDTEEE